MHDLEEIDIELFEGKHDVAQFSCGVSQLDDYLKKYASQDTKRGYSKTFVLTRAEVILGYYTLSGGSIDFDFLPDSLKRKVPRYPMPVAHLGRLAIDSHVQGRGYGELLLMDCLRRVAEISHSFGLAAVEVRAKSSNAKLFYERYGFVQLEDDPLHLYLPIRVIKDLFC